MHPKIEESIRELESQIESIKEFDSLCYKVESLEDELKKIEGFNSLTISIYPWCVDVLIFVEDVKSITNVLVFLCKHFGKIIHRSIEPERKQFDFDFYKLETRFAFSGDSCKLVKVDERVEKHGIFELRCGNGEGTVITEESIQV